MQFLSIEGYLTRQREREGTRVGICCHDCAITVSLPVSLIQGVLMVSTLAWAAIGFTRNEDV
jgi:hypothetical protein